METPPRPRGTPKTGQSWTPVSTEDPEEAVGPAEGRARTAAQENDQLLAEREVLQGQRGAGSEGRPGGGDDGEKVREHGPSVYPLATMGKRWQRQISQASEFLRTTGTSTSRTLLSLASEGERPSNSCSRVAMVQSTPLLVDATPDVQLAPGAGVGARHFLSPSPCECEGSRWAPDAIDRS
jgi:hypothetical protein